MSIHTVFALLVMVVVLCIVAVVGLLGAAWWCWLTEQQRNAKRLVRYRHHQKEVVVRADLKGRHREHCLCYGCGKFNPVSKEKQCPIAKAVFDNCVKFDLVTPVWECPQFRPQNEQQQHIPHA